VADSTLDDLSELRAEMARLQQEVAGLRALIGTPPDSGEGPDEPLLLTDERTGRRGLLKAAGAAALGATVVGLIDTVPAGAAANPVLLNQTNTATANTEVSTTAGNGLEGVTSADGQAGLEGSDTSVSGGYGVRGDSGQGIGVYGTLVDDPSGLLGSTVAGVVGDCHVRAGILGLSAVSVGVQGVSTELNGVYGTLSSGQSGLSAPQAGVLGDSSLAFGVIGLSSGESGVMGQTSSNGNAGVFGNDTSDGGGIGLFADSLNGIGVWADGGLAPLRLVPSASAGAPSTGTHTQGEFYVDSNAALYRCIVAGTPGTWLPMYSVVPLAAPVRVLDTTNGTGGLTGPFAANGATHTTSILTGGATGIPDMAVGVAGNLTISGNGATLNGDGYLTLFPGGAGDPGTSSLNSGGGAFATSNGVTVAFGTGPSAGKLAFSWQGGGSPPACQVFLDVTAYIL
jgi:hypothetical protein